MEKDNRRGQAQLPENQITAPVADNSQPITRRRGLHPRRTVGLTAIAGAAALSLYAAFGADSDAEACGGPCPTPTPEPSPTRVAPAPTPTEISCIPTDLKGNVVNFSKDETDDANMVTDNRALFHFENLSQDTTHTCAEMVGVKTFESPHLHPNGSGWLESQTEVVGSRKVFLVPAGTSRDEWVNFTNTGGCTVQVDAVKAGNGLTLEQVMELPADKLSGDAMVEFAFWENPDCIPTATPTVTSSATATSTPTEAPTSTDTPTVVRKAKTHTPTNTSTSVPIEATETPVPPAETPEPVDTPTATPVRIVTTLVDSGDGSSGKRNGILLVSGILSVVGAAVAMGGKKIKETADSVDHTFTGLRRK